MQVVSVEPHGAVRIIDPGLGPFWEIIGEDRGKMAGKPWEIDDSVAGINAFLLGWNF